MPSCLLLVLMSLFACRPPLPSEVPDATAVPQGTGPLHTGPEPWQPGDEVEGVPSRVLASGWSEDGGNDPAGGEVLQSPEALQTAMARVGLEEGADLWNQADPARESLILLTGDTQDHTTHDLWLVAVFQLGGLVDIQWRIPASGPERQARPWMLVAIEGVGVTDVVVELDVHPL